MVDEDWQLSKDSADAATAGNNFACTKCIIPEL